MDEVDLVDPPKLGRMDDADADADGDGDRRRSKTRRRLTSRVRQVGQSPQLQIRRRAALFAVAHFRHRPDFEDGLINAPHEEHLRLDKQLTQIPQRLL